jgi:uncharacterized OB-fold protein
MTSPLDPVVDDCNRTFFESAAAGVLRIQACAVCGLHRHPPHERCPRCHGAEVVWREAGSTGRIWSFVVGHPPLPGPFAEIAPVTVVLADLDEPEGIRVMGTLLDAGDRTPEIGDPVEIVFASVAGGPVLPHWRLAP